MLTPHHPSLVSTSPLPMLAGELEATLSDLLSHPEADSVPDCGPQQPEMPAAERLPAWAGASRLDEPLPMEGQTEFMLDALVLLSERRRPARSGHGRRVADLAQQLARAGGLDNEESAQIARAARYLDIGMATVPLAVLAKQGRLTEGERDEINRHASAGAALLSRIDAPWASLAARIALHHHEWWSGAGYPNGLMGLSIPLEARIVAVCDVFQALIGGSVTREAMTVDEALEVISDGAGDQFDPHLACLFVALIRQGQGAAERWPG